MSTFNLKSFIPYLVNGTSVSNVSEDKLESNRSVDPSGTQWSSAGLVEPFPGEGLKVDLQGAGTLMLVQLNDRILPSKVRDELLAKKVEHLQQLEGRKVTKKEYRQLRDEAEGDLLPKAFIRRTLVPILFVNFGSDTAMLVCTSSHKKADDIAALLMDFFNDTTFVPWKIQTDRPLENCLTTLVKHGELPEDYGFEADSFAVLRGEKKKTIRIKDKSLGDQDLDALWKQDYAVSELGVSRFNGEFEDTFVVTDAMVFKSMRVAGFYTAPKKNAEPGDVFNHVYGLATAYRKILRDFVEACGGLAERPKVESSASDKKPFIDPDL